MIRIVSDATNFLVNRIEGKKTKVELSEEVVKSVTVRLEEPTLREIEKLVEETDGWSRNLVVNFLLMGGIELVRTQLAQRGLEVEGGEE